MRRGDANAAAASNVLAATHLDVPSYAQAYEPPSPALVKRMTSIVNAELLAVASIPLAATLMARGVAYADWLPWQAGAAPVALALGGFGYKYAKEALDWQEA